MKNNSKILIVRLSAIGDVVHSLPILHSLKKKFPGCYIGWAVEDRASDIIVNNPLVDKAFVFPRSKWKKRGFSPENLREFCSIITEIRREKFDIAIDVQELFKSAVIAYLSGAKRRIGHRGTREFADLFINDKLPAHNTFDPEKLIIERYLEAAKHLGADSKEIEFPLPPINEEAKKKIDGLLPDTEGKELVIFAPSTIWPSKHWLEEYWTTLLDRLSKKYKVVFIGTAKDNELINRIKSHAISDDSVNLSGKTSILELIEVFNRAKYVVAPDTGPAHIANATQNPGIIMLFGSTGARRTPPVGDKHSALSAELPCQPCFKRNCPRKDNPMEFMKKLTPESVLKKID